MKMAVSKNTEGLNSAIETRDWNILQKMIEEDVSLLDVLSKKLVSDDATNQQIVNILAKSYERLKIQNVQLSKECESLVADRLVRSRFSAKKKSVFKGKAQTQSMVPEIIDSIHAHIQDLHDRYYKKHDREIDTRFFLTLRLIAQNLQVLKRQRETKAISNELPWEEMEFCVLNYLSSSLLPEAANLTYKLVMDRDRILYHLQNFIKCLLVKRQGPTLHITSVNRDIITKSIVSENPRFRALYADYEIIKDVYSLKQIQDYIGLACSADTESNIGHLVIERALQVIGECLKNTPQSPNLSDAIHTQLLAVAPRGLKDILTSLRNSLSHSHTLKKKIKLEERKNKSEFFRTMQNDLKKLLLEVTGFLQQKKIVAVQLFLKKIERCSSLKEVKTLGQELYPLRGSEKLFVTDHTTPQFNEIERLVTELKLEMGNSKTESRLLSEIDKIVKAHAERLNEANAGFANTAVKLSDIFNGSDLHNIKRFASIYSDKVNPPNVEHLKTIKDLLNDVRVNIILKRPELTGCLAIIYNISCIIDFELERITGIRELKEQLEETEIEDTDDLRLVDDVLDEIVREMGSEKDTLEERIEARRDFFLTKTKLMALFQNDIEDDEKQNCYKLIERLKMDSSKENELKSHIDTGNLSEIKDILQKVDSYSVLLKNIPNCDFFSLKDIEKFLNNFLKPLCATQKIKKQVEEALQAALEKRKTEIKSYYSKRLAALESLINSHDNQSISAMEILLLDLTEILEKLDFFGNYDSFLQEYSPVLVGKPFRNYLAHGNPLINVLPINPLLSLMVNANILIEEGEDLLDRCNITIGNFSAIDFNVRDKEYLALADDQEQLLVAAKLGNLQQIKDCVARGASVQGRDFYGRDCLDFAVQGDYAEIFKFFLEHNLSRDNISFMVVSNNSENVFKYLQVTEQLDIRQIDQHGKNLLHIAVENNQTSKQIVEALIQMKADVNAEAHGGWRPLHYAVYGNNLDATISLVKAGADINSQFRDGCTALHIAAQHNYKCICQYLLENGIDATIADIDGYTALHFAALNGHHELVDSLIGFYSDVNVTTNTSFTALHLAVQQNHKDTVIALLQNKYVNVNACDVTPLHLAAQYGLIEIVDILLERGADIHATRSMDGAEPLHFAANMGHANVILRLLERGANIEAKNKIGQTALHLSALKGHIHALLVVIKRGANINVKEVGGSTPLHLAAEADRKKAVAKLLEWGSSANDTNREGTTPLHIAACNGYEGVVRILLQHGADVNKKRVDETALHFAASNGHLGTVLLLLQHHADIYAFGRYGRTPVLAAAANGHKDVLLNLLQAWCDATTELGETALHLATRNGHQNVIELLIEYKAEINSEKKDKITPLHLAALSGSKENVQLLLEHKADVNAISMDDTTPLHCAARSGREDVTSLLLENGANLYAKRNGGITALHVASLNGHKGVVTILLQAWINAKCNLGMTALHYACLRGNTDGVSILIARRAELNCKNQDGRTPLDLAIQEGHADTVNLLRSYNANSSPLAAPVESKNRKNAKAKAQKDKPVTLFDYKITDAANTKEGISDIHIKAANGDLSGLQDCNINVRSKSGITPLHYAAGNNQKAMVSLLLERGADVNAKTINKITPLHVAASEGHTDIVHALFKQNADLYSTTNKNLTALHLAAQNGHSSIIEALLKGWIDSKDDYGYTALDLAIQSNHTYVVKELRDWRAQFLELVKPVETFLEDSYIISSPSVLENPIESYKDSTELHRSAFNGQVDKCLRLIAEGANLCSRAADGVTALHLAAWSGHYNVSEALLNAFVGIKNLHGVTPLHAAAKYGHNEVVKLLLDRKSDVTALDPKNKLTALHLAAEYGHKDVVSTLLQHGSDPNAENVFSLRPLHFAANNGHKDVVEVLLKADNIDVHACDRDGKTALDYARLNNKKQVTQLLEN